MDAIWANTTNNTNYNYNTMHVEDPNPLIGEFLVEEIAPKTLYLSNRTIKGDQFICGDAQVMNKYYADFEARNSVLIGNQSNPHLRQRTPEGDFIVENGGVVTVRANNADGQSVVVLGAGFSAKSGSIFRAYVNGDNYCSPFTYRVGLDDNSKSPKTPIKEPRKIITKNTSTIKENLSKANPLLMYPNPASGSTYITLNENTTFTYTIIDVAGKTILTGIIDSNNEEIKLNGIESGIYLITITNDRFKQTEKLIIQ